VEALYLVLIAPVTREKLAAAMVAGQFAAELDGSTVCGGGSRAAGG